MALTASQLATRIGTICRNVAVLLIAGVFRGRSLREINQIIKSRPLFQQALIVCGVLALLLALSLISAQFGWIAMLLFWLAVILLVN